MIVQSFPSGPFETNAYVIGCEKSKFSAIIDPAPNSSSAIVSYLNERNLIPKMILITHSHWDHIGDAAALKEKFQCPVYVHPLDRANLQRPGSDGLPLWASIIGVQPDRLFEEGEIIEIGELKLQVIHTPGHSPGGICLYCPEHHTLLSGDTLFSGSIGNLSFPTANPEDMWASLDKLAKLPPETIVYPGHGPTTTIGREHWLPRAKEIFGGY
jgi:hydroxyacylglutathione hydrolase